VRPPKPAALELAEERVALGAEFRCTGLIAAVVCRV
jgi:hypothetical protein